MGKGQYMEIEREKSCCFTGHRRLSRQEGLWVRTRLRAEIARLVGMGVAAFLAGGALGFDTIAAQEVLRAKGELFPQKLALVLVLPCLGQDKLWSQRDSAVYRTLLRQADEIIYTGDVYDRDCMLVRNRFLVDNSAHCLCYLHGTARGGTAYTVRYALQQGVAVTNLAKIREGSAPLPPSRHGPVK